MPWGDQIKTSLFGRRLGLQTMSTGECGAATGKPEKVLLVGPDDFRTGVKSESTGTNLDATGMSICSGTSVGSSAVYTLDPPIPGCRKYIYGGATNGPVYIKTANAETFATSVGSSHTTIKISSNGGGFELIGMTTAQWLSLDITSGTSSQASGFGLTTTT